MWNILGISLAFESRLKVPEEIVVTAKGSEIEALNNKIKPRIFFPASFPAQPNKNTMTMTQNAKKTDPNKI